MITVRFNIIKFDHHACIIFQDCEHPSMTIIMKIMWNDIIKYCHGIINYNHGCDEMTSTLNFNQLCSHIVIKTHINKVFNHG
jgi:hypothetical protein